MLNETFLQILKHPKQNTSSLEFVRLKVQQKFIFESHSCLTSKFNFQTKNIEKNIQIKNFNPLSLILKFTFSINNSELNYTCLFSKAFINDKNIAGKEKLLHYNTIYQASLSEKFLLLKVSTICFNFSSLILMAKKSTIYFILHFLHF